VIDDDSSKVSWEEKVEENKVYADAWEPSIHHGQNIDPRDALQEKQQFTEFTVDADEVSNYRENHVGEKNSQTVVEVETHEVFDQGNAQQYKNETGLGVTAWERLNVGSWLNGIGLPEYKNIFAKHNIVGKSICEMSRRIEDVKFLMWIEQRLGFTDNFGDLMVLVAELRKLNNPTQ